jgi:hypothetical protein
LSSSGGIEQWQNQTIWFYVIRILYAVSSQENNIETKLFPRFSDTNKSNDIKRYFNSIVFKLYENAFEAQLLATYGCIYLSKFC